MRDLQLKSRLTSLSIYRFLFSDTAARIRFIFAAQNKKKKEEGGRGRGETVNRVQFYSPHFFCLFVTRTKPIML